MPIEIDSKWVTNYIKSVMFEAKIAYSGKSPEQIVLDTTDRHATIMQLPPVVTYEGVVLLNPLDSDPLTFSVDQPDRENEILFYRVHRDIERELYMSISMLASTIELDFPEQIVIEKLQYSKKHLQNTVLKMAELYKNLDKESFWRFREFFREIPFRLVEGMSYPWASWASSSAFPALNILFWIPEVTPLSPLAHLVMPRLDSREYTTIHTLARLRAITQEKWTIQQKYVNQPWIIDLANDCIQYIEKFRRMHLGSVKKFIPEAMQGKQSGTGWSTDVPWFLGKAIEDTRKAKI